jgi:hypothetical protein
VDLSNATNTFTQRCYEADGRIVLFTSTARCNLTVDDGTIYASISNDPVCIASNCSLDQARYNVIDRYETLLIDTAVNADCFEYLSGRIQLTTLSGMCAAETLLLQTSLAEVAMLKKCNTSSSSSCVRNYTAAAEVYYRMCRGKGGDAFRAPERMATCLDNIDRETVLTEVNVPFCFSGQCTPDAIREEEQFLNEQWSDGIAPDYQSCGFAYTAWEAVNFTGSNDSTTSSGGRRFVNKIWQWTPLFAILAIPLCVIV